MFACFDNVFKHIYTNKAFLQRVINGGGHIHREYAVGRKRVDLLVIWKKYRYVIELKIKYSEDTLRKGLEQTKEYIDLCNGQERHLLIYDRTPGKTWEEKIANELIEFNGQKIHVWSL